MQLNGNNVKRAHNVDMFIWFGVGSITKVYDYVLIYKVL